MGAGFLDPVGWQLHIRMNSLNPPFNDAKARQAVQMLVESRQEAYLSATGQTGAGRATTSLSYLYPGGPPTSDTL